jgi:hypothetical protein
MFNVKQNRTAEQGHEKECLAAAMIAAIENYRDDISSSLDFRQSAQRNEFLEVADGYLADGTFTCLCPPIPDPTTECGVTACSEQSIGTFIVQEPGEGDDELQLCADHVNELEKLGAIIVGV